MQFQLSVPVGKLASNFDAELHAIAIALEEVAKRDFCKTALLVDSQAAISAVTGYDDKDDIIIKKCRALIDRLLTQGKQVVLQWIPSHVGLQGNEEADRLAKEL
ncbi:ribonuclease H1-like [Rhodnius prolixus]|uniref:ribonuclease H1-like n=1 Tax=Rhodnius prolixus TaxID=13249 RepID=UPI003D1896BA